jgi:hypothetical protein
MQGCNGLARDALVNEAKAENKIMVGTSLCEKLIRHDSSWADRRYAILP